MILFLVILELAENLLKNEPAKDFYIQDEADHNITGLINLFGIESPGLTSSLSIGNKIVEYFY